MGSGSSLMTKVHREIKRRMFVCQSKTDIKKKAEKSERTGGMRRAQTREGYGSCELDGAAQCEINGRQLFVRRGGGGETAAHTCQNTAGGNGIPPPWEVTWSLGGQRGERAGKRRRVRS